MRSRRSEYDVTDTVNVTEVDATARAVCRLYRELYPGAPTASLEQAFEDLERLYRGDFRGYFPCESPYHDLQHALDVTLAMARLIAGYESGPEPEIGPIGPFGALVGLVATLFHDSGYIRRWSDNRHQSGAELTPTHVTRGGRFLAGYLPTIGLAHAVPIAQRLLHFTGYEMLVRDIPLADQRLRRLGKMMGTADLLAQMADRCYLEKCRDRLYPEFVASGLARPTAPGGGYDSPEMLILKTPLFFQHVRARLEEDFLGVHRYFERVFDGRNPYLEEVERNQAYLLRVVEAQDLSMLRRNPPWTLNRDIPRPEPKRSGQWPRL